MPVNLSKGQKVDLTKTNPGLTRLIVGLGWDVNHYDGGSDFDLDTAAFLTGENGRVSADSDFIFYGNLTHSSGGLAHLGDNRTGEGEGDDEQLRVDLSLVPAHVSTIAFTATIHEADERRQNFGQVSGAYIRVVNEETGEELIRYDLSEDFSIETAVTVGTLYRHGSEWKFNAVGSGFQGGLRALCNHFGVDTD